MATKGVRVNDTSVCASTGAARRSLASARAGVRVTEPVSGFRVLLSADAIPETEAGPSFLEPRIPSVRDAAGASKGGPRAVGGAVWTAFLEQVTEDVHQLPELRVLKSSPDVEVVQTFLTDECVRLSVVVKRYNERRRRGWRRWFTKSLAAGDYRTLQRLRSKGIAVPRPLAAVSSRGSRTHSWLVTEFEDGLIELEQVALSLLSQLPARVRPQVRRGVVGAVVDFYLALDAGELHHRDLKASNLLLQNWGGEGGPTRVWIADVEGFRNGHRRLTVKRRQRLVRLGASLLGYAQFVRTDAARFLMAYSRHLGWSRDQRRAEWRDLARAAQEYARRSASRKQHKIDAFGG